MVPIYGVPTPLIRTVVLLIFDLALNFGIPVEKSNPLHSGAEQDCLKNHI